MPTPTQHSSNLLLSALAACWPYAALIVGLLIVLRLLVWGCGARLQLARLRQLHTEETGSVQSLSFVIALPLFMLILMGIVQISQLMIARVFLEYAAFAAARSAMVWIPASVYDGHEDANQIGQLVPVSADDGGTYYRIEDVESHKLFRIRMAAAQALLPISPSRDTTYSTHDAPGFVAYESMLGAYRALAPDADDSVPRRLANKLSWSLNATSVEVRIFHPGTEPDLIWHDIFPYREELQNEVGWQDAITVTVEHQVALLPGPARMFQKLFTTESDERGETTSPVTEVEGTYVWPLRASATLGNEGQKPLIPYEHVSNGLPL